MVDTPGAHHVRDPMLCVGHDHADRGSLPASSVSLNRDRAHAVLLRIQIRSRTQNRLIVMDVERLEGLPRDDVRGLLQLLAAEDPTPAPAPCG